MKQSKGKIGQIYYVLGGPKVEIIKISSPKSKVRYLEVSKDTHGRKLDSGFIVARKGEERYVYNISLWKHKKEYYKRKKENENRI